MTNALTGVATAAADSTPMLVITGQHAVVPPRTRAAPGHPLSRRRVAGDIYRPVCKRVWRVDDAKFLIDVMPRALNVAQTGRPGAVLIDVPMDVFSQQIERDARDRRPASELRAGGRLPRLESPPRPSCCASARSPVIFAGNGVTLSEAQRRTARGRGAARRAGGDHADGEGRLPRRPRRWRSG